MINAVAMFTHNELGKRSHSISFSQKEKPMAWLTMLGRRQPTRLSAVDFDHAMERLAWHIVPSWSHKPCANPQLVVVDEFREPSRYRINAPMTDTHKHTSISGGTGELAAEGAVDDDGAGPPKCTR